MGIHDIGITRNPAGHMGALFPYSLVSSGKKIGDE